MLLMPMLMPTWMWMPTRMRMTMLLLGVFLWLFSLAERNKDQKMPARQQQWPTTIIIANGNNKLGLRQKRNTKFLWEERARVVFSRRQDGNNNRNNKGVTRWENKITHTHTKSDSHKKLLKVSVSGVCVRVSGRDSPEKSFQLEIELCVP